MIKRWIENLGFTASNDDADIRRGCPRRTSDSVITTINNTTYAVENWSEGGLLVNGDNKLFSVDQPLDLLIKFKLTDRLVEIRHQGVVVRKTTGRMGIRFTPLPSSVSQSFKQVIDDAVTREFAESQMA